MLISICIFACFHWFSQERILIYTYTLILIYTYIYLYLPILILGFGVSPQFMLCVIQAVLALFPLTLFWLPAPNLHVSTTPEPSSDRIKAIVDNIETQQCQKLVESQCLDQCEAIAVTVCTWQNMRRSRAKCFAQISAKHLSHNNAHLACVPKTICTQLVFNQ